MKKFLKYFLIVLLVMVVIFLSLGVMMPTQEYTITTTVNAPVEKTFAIFNDTSKMREWMPGFVSIENTGGAAHETGSKWKIVFREGGKEIVMTETVTAFKENELFSFNIKNDFINSDNDVRFVANANGGTDIIAHAKYRGGHILQKAMFVFLNGYVKNSQREYYELLKQLVEKS